METFNVATLAYVLHEIDTTVSTAQLGAFMNFEAALTDTTLKDQIEKTLQLAERLFARQPLGRCANYVSDLRHELTKPLLTIAVATSLFHRLKRDILGECLNCRFLQLPEAEFKRYEAPLAAWGVAASKFPPESMEAASRCLAVGEDAACVYHSMCVLEHGLRWLGSQFQLTLSKPMALENWNTIIENIEKAIEAARKVPGAAKTIQGDADLAFYSRAAKEFQYFRVGWRNHVMHDRQQAYDSGSAGSLLNHVIAFMQILAERA